MTLSPPALLHAYIVSHMSITTTISNKTSPAMTTGPIDLAALRAAAMKSAKGKRMKRAGSGAVSVGSSPEKVVIDLTSPEKSHLPPPLVDQQQPLARPPPAIKPIPPQPSYSGPSVSSSSPIKPHAVISPAAPVISIAGPSRPPGLPPKPVLPEKEEGEISDEDQTPRPPVRKPAPNRNSISPTQRTFASTHQRRRSSDKNPQAVKSPPVSRKETPYVKKGKQKIPPLGSLPSAPASLSTDDASQYMDIIRNLLFDGFSPETLISRGATRSYVTSVCEEIVQDTKRRKTLWLETREVRHESEAPSTAGVPNSGKSDFITSPSPEIIVMQRSISMSSESSAEFELLEMPERMEMIQLKMAAAREKPNLSLKPASSWVPPKAQLSPKPIPTGPSASTRTVDHTLTTASSTASNGTSSTITPTYFNRPPPTQPRNHPKDLPLRPIVPIDSYHAETISTTKRRKPKDIDRMGSDNTMLIYEEEALSGLAPKTVAVKTPSTAAAVILPPSLPPKPIVPPPDSPPPLPITPPVVPEAVLPEINIGPVITDKSSRDAELAARLALLTTRLKVKESIKLRKGKSKAISTPIIPLLELETPVESSELSISVEEEVAQLEREVMGLHTRQGTPMDIDESEEGEIMESPPLPDPPPAPPLMSVVASSSSFPLRPLRGTKRPNAEDMENRPTSLPSRIPPSKRRSVFGSVQQRSHRLIIHLDDSDSDDSDDEGNMKTAVPSGTATPIVIPVMLGESDTQRLLREKEEGIQRLRKQIEERMKRHEARLRNGSEGVMTPDPEVVDAAVVTVLASAAKATGATADQADRGEDTEMGVPDSLDGSAQQNRSETIQVDPNVEDDNVVILDTTSSASLSFRAYQPLLRRYPQLTNPTAQSSAFTQYSTAALTNSNAGLDEINQSLLDSIILTRRLLVEHNAIICAAEAGGGRCADPGCQNLHLSRIEPSGEFLLRSEAMVAALFSLTRLNHPDDDLADYIGHFIQGKKRSTILSAIRLAKDSKATIATGPTEPAKKRKKGKVANVALKEDRANQLGLIDVPSLIQKVGQLLS